LSQECKKQFSVGDLVCYKGSSNRKICGIITKVNRVPKSAEEGELVKVYWCIDNEMVDISPLSYPPIRKGGWIAAGLLRSVGNLEVVSKKQKNNDV
tara:strand:+ start:1391 stop:1678 length:288 start_codon:yes stop_codon:yes gene_type:complete